MSGRGALADAVARLEELAAALAAGGEAPEDMAGLAAEAVQVSEEITRLLAPVLEGTADGGA